MISLAEAAFHEKETAEVLCSFHIEPRGPVIHCIMAKWLSRGIFQGIEKRCPVEQKKIYPSNFLTGGCASFAVHFHMAMG